MVAFNRKTEERNVEMKKIMLMGVLGVMMAAATFVGLAAVRSSIRDTTRKNSESSVVTNDNGSVSRTFTEATVTTNGSMVTEHRRETRTTVDGDGNMLATTTSEYEQSYTIGDEGLGALTQAPASRAAAKATSDEPAPDNDRFLGLVFGAEMTGTNFVADIDEPTLLRTTFAPKKPLAGFDDYYVYVTPKTHRIVKVFACAKDAVEPGTSWRRHYLIEALEKRYQTWARPRSWCRPVYTFDIGSGRYVTACLACASRDYETVVVAWDDAMLTVAADETEAIREEARKSAAEKRRARVQSAADAF